MAINYKEKSFMEQVPGLHLDWFGFSSFTTIYKLEHIFLFCRIQSYQTRGYLCTLIFLLIKQVSVLWQGAV